MEGGGSDAGGGCRICLDNTPAPIQCGCACRGEAGLAHPGCMVQAAVARQEQKARLAAAWRTCGLCGTNFTGAMMHALASEGAR